MIWDTTHSFTSLSCLIALDFPGLSFLQHSKCTMLLSVAIKGPFCLIIAIQHFLFWQVKKRKKTFSKETLFYTTLISNFSKVTFETTQILCKIYIPDLENGMILNRTPNFGGQGREKQKEMGLFFERACIFPDTICDWVKKEQKK